MDKHLAALIAAAELPNSDVRLSALADVPTEILATWGSLISDAIALQRDRVDNGEPAYPDKAPGPRHPATLPPASDAPAIPQPTPDVQAALAALVGFVRYVACPVCSYDVRIENGIIRGHRYKGEWCSTSRGLLIDAVRDAGRKS